MQGEMGTYLVSARRWKRDTSPFMSSPVYVVPVYVVPVSPFMSSVHVVQGVARHADRGRVRRVVLGEGLRPADRRAPLRGGRRAGRIHRAREDVARPGGARPRRPDLRTDGRAGGGVISESVGDITFGPGIEYV